MDRSPGLSPPSLPSGTEPNERPGTPRKRSLQDVENGVQGHEGENQENTDPGDAKGSLEGVGDVRKGEGEGEEGGSGVRVEIPLSSILAPNTAMDASMTTTANENRNASANANANNGNATPAAKRRKVSPTSKEAKQQEKEAKERQKAEDKAKKDEEKKKRDVEREEEKKRREEKKRIKDEERAVKEEEKKKKDEEKSKKERVGLFTDVGSQGMLTG